MHKLIAITLLAVFGLPFASSFFVLTPKSEANLPACCRRNGKHHCMMSMAEQSKLQDDKPGFAAFPERCPYCPAVVMGVRTPVHFKPSVCNVLPASFVSHSAGIAQTECKLRIALDRARGKRGPPLRSNLKRP